MRLHTEPGLEIRVDHDHTRLRITVSGDVDRSNVQTLASVLDDFRRLSGEPAEPVTPE